LEVKVPKENVYAAALERFPFLARYARNSVWSVYLEPVNADLAGEYPQVGGSWRCPCQTRIILLGPNGDEIGFVGKRPKVIPTTKFLWWTVRPAETVVEQFHETVQQALQRYKEQVRWVLTTSEQGVAWGYNATLFFPPDGQSVNECLARLLEEKRQAEQAQMEEYDARLRRQEAETLATQRRLLRQKLQT
jgi:hypothetical protein